MGEECRAFVIRSIISGLLTVQTQVYESQISMTAFGFVVQQQLSSDLLATFSNVMSAIRCAGYCNRQQLCRLFDHDMTAGACHIFSNGLVVSSNLTRSRAGTFYDAPDLYSTHGEQCTSSNCQFNRNLICGSNNTCQCPTDLVWNTQMCVGKWPFNESSVDTGQ